MIECNDYRLAFLLPRSRQLLGVADQDTVELPVISVPLSKRLAEQATKLIEEEWKINSIVLDILSDPTSHTPCLVIEVQTGSWDFERDGFQAVHPNEISDLSLSTRQRRCLLDIVLANDRARDPWSQLGWIEEAECWIQQSVHDREVVFSGAIEQLNGGGPFALIHFGTVHAPGYWLKATGGYNALEFQVTRALTKFFPDALPPLIAARADWGAWVTEDAGATLRECASSEALENAATTLADLQIRSTGHVKALLAAGCADRSLRAFMANLDEIIDFLKEAMHQQTSTKAPRLSDQQLDELRIRLDDACFQMQELDVPDTLVHGDMNLGNILFDRTRCVFIDWAEACIGSPFLGLEYLRVHMSRADGQVRSSIPRIIALYRREWLSTLSESTIDRALSAIPILAIALYLYGRGDWLRSSRRDDPSFQSFARTLTRRMYSADSSIHLSEALCP